MSKEHVTANHRIDSRILFFIRSDGRILALDSKKAESRGGCFKGDIAEEQESKTEEKVRKEGESVRRQLQEGNRTYLLPEARRKGTRAEGIGAWAASRPILKAIGTNMPRWKTR